MARRVVQIGQQAYLPGWGVVTATEIVVGDRRSVTKRYVRGLTEAGVRVSGTEAAFLKRLLPADTAERS